MQKLLLVSHSHYANGVKGAVEMIVGKMQEIDAICLSEDKSSEQFTTEVQQLLTTEAYVNANSIIVLADLRGGSPHTNSLKVLDELNVLTKTTVITGMNLALAIGIAMIDDFTDSAKIQLAVDEAKDNIAIFAVEETEDEEL